MENPFKKKTAKGYRKSSDPLRGKIPSSDEYVERLRLAQKENIKVSDEADLDGYESDHVPTLPQRCMFTFKTKKFSLSSLDLPKTAPPSPNPSMMDNISPASLPSRSLDVKYSLRSVIGDGTQQPDGPTVMERRNLRPNGCHLNVSHWSAEGLRPYMEDRYVIDELRSMKHGEASKAFSTPMTCFGVFDGHGGDRASQYCCDRLTSYLYNQPDFPHDIGKALKHAFFNMDKDFVRTRLTDGTTACVCVVVGGERVICANAGDSRAISIRRDGSVAKLSRDHKPGVPDETKRITDLGGRIVYWGRWRVEGVLAVSRSIGDAALKPYISADPEICEYRISDEDMLLVLASDGIWDVIDNLEVGELMLNEACTHINNTLEVDPERLKIAARILCDKAGSSGSTDNLSVIVVDLTNRSQID